MEVKLINSDKDWLNKAYPDLVVDISKGIIYGEISFKLNFNGYKIDDRYQVRVDFNNLDTIGLPKVFEISDKIDSIAKKYNIPLEDLHINSDNSFCLVIEGEEGKLFKNDFTVKEFFENAIEKFLYQISFYEQNGYFPWGEYAHGYLGFLELYAEDGIEFDSLLSKLDKLEIIECLLVNRQSMCLCGSREKLRKCHPLVFKGIQMIKNEVR